MFSLNSQNGTGISIHISNGVPTTISLFVHQVLQYIGVTSVSSHQGAALITSATLFFDKIPQYIDVTETSSPHRTFFLNGSIKLGPLFVHQVSQHIQMTLPNRRFESVESHVLMAPDTLFIYQILQDIQVTCLGSQLNASGTVSVLSPLCIDQVPQSVLSPLFIDQVPQYVQMTPLNGQYEKPSLIIFTYGLIIDCVIIDQASQLVKVVIYDIPIDTLYNLSASSHPL